MQRPDSDSVQLFHRIDLKNMAQTCRAFRAAAMPSFYRTMVLRIPSGDKSPLALASLVNDPGDGMQFVESIAVESIAVEAGNAGDDDCKHTLACRQNLELLLNISIRLLLMHLRRNQLRSFL